jgi:hypothetical protein
MSRTQAPNSIEQLACAAPPECSEAHHVAVSADTPRSRAGEGGDRLSLLPGGAPCHPREQDANEEKGQTEEGQTCERDRTRNEGRNRYGNGEDGDCEDGKSVRPLDHRVVLPVRWFARRLVGRGYPRAPGCKRVSAARRREQAGQPTRWYVPRIIRAGCGRANMRRIAVGLAVLGLALTSAAPAGASVQITVRLDSRTTNTSTSSRGANERNGTTSRRSATVSSRQTVIWIANNLS